MSCVVMYRSLRRVDHSSRGVYRVSLRYPKLTKFYIHSYIHVTIKMFTESCSHRGTLC